MRLVVRIEAGLIPDIPLIERQVDLLAGLALSPDGIRSRDDRFDEVVHVDGRREEALRVAIVLLVVGVQRDVVHLVVRVVQHRVLPRAERRHARVGAAHCDELDRRVDELHGLRGLLRETAVLVGGLVTDLPRTVKLVAEAPQLDVEGLLCAVLATHVAPSGASRVVGVLDERASGIHSPCAEVDRLHHLDLGLASPVDELVQTERVGLNGVPGTVDARRPLIDRSDAVLPVEARDEVASRVPHDRWAHLLHKLEHVTAEAPLVGLRMPRLVDAGVHAAPHVLDERAEEATRHLADAEVAVDGDVGGCHESPCSMVVAGLTDRRSRWSRCP